MDIKEVREKASKHAEGINKIYTAMLDEYQRNGVSVNPMELRKNAEYLYILSNLPEIKSEAKKVTKK